jgi:hypothetical protein
MAAKPTKRELELYSLPPEEFVAARNELSKKLAKPTVPAWAVNRAAADDPDAAAALIDSGERLAKAQRGAGGGGGGDALRDAMTAHGAAIESLMGAVNGVLREAGHATTANLDRARDTLRAVATDDALRRELEQRRISKDREPVGFGSAPEPSASGRRAKKPAARARRAAQRELAAAEKAAKRARAKLERADTAVAGAQERLEEAQSARDEAAEELERAEEAENDARRALD